MVLGAICNMHDTRSSMANMICAGCFEDLTIYKRRPAYRPGADEAGSKIAYLQSRHGSF